MNELEAKNSNDYAKMAKGQNKIPKSASSD
jgi:hypothetical protein